MKDESGDIQNTPILTNLSTFPFPKIGIFIAFMKKTLYTLPEVYEIMGKDLDYVHYMLDINEEIVDKVLSKYDIDYVISWMGENKTILFLRS